MTTSYSTQKTSSVQVYETSTVYLASLHFKHDLLIKSISKCDKIPKIDFCKFVFTFCHVYSFAPMI